MFAVNDQSIQQLRRDFRGAKIKQFHATGSGHACPAGGQGIERLFR
jgi:hypothetical protein